MPKREDIKRILVIGAGPIVIGQACEFDYSGVQACKALREAGYEVVLVNSNPATIMTDPTMADATYIEPIHWEIVARIIEKERPCALLPTMGGQTALNCAMTLSEKGVLEQYHVSLIGVDCAAIENAEDRQKFIACMGKVGLRCPRSCVVTDLASAMDVVAQIGFPVVIRPSFTLGGAGGGVAYNKQELKEICQRGFSLSPLHQVLLDESIIGWKEFETEVICDKQGNAIVVCVIENVDPLGVHTGDSITVAPAQTLTDKEYQAMRTTSFTVLEAVGMCSGAANVQFAVNPKNGELNVIEMNPRVSRSSALASKATGFPIARIAAMLSVGYTLGELSNDITRGKMPASFEPSLDYVVTKIPRFNFDKFPETDPRLTTKMKSVGEVMAIGRNFQESLQKALSGLEVDRCGLESPFTTDTAEEEAKAKIRYELMNPSWDRIWYIAAAFRRGFTCEAVRQLTQIDPWFLTQIQDLVDSEEVLSSLCLKDLSAQQVFALKRQGFSDERIGQLLGVSAQVVQQHRKSLGVTPVFKRVDSCAAEFPTETAYLYSTYDAFSEARVTKKPKVMVLGGGPNRIGQGIEFDYCCVHAAMALREQGYETIMVNCNPETVSTDYDMSDRLYFEPLSLGRLMDIIDIESPQGVIVHYGGQTPLKLARALESQGIPIIGTSPDAIDRAEDRERFQRVVNKLGLKQPLNGIIRSREEGLRLASVFDYPFIVRPSYVLGGHEMDIIRDPHEFSAYLSRIANITQDAPLLLDHFLDNAIEVDIDAVCDGERVLIAGIMEHIEQAGIHSGDSACCFPPHGLSEQVQDQLCEQMRLIALELGVVGLINAQFAIKGETIYVLEVNPRASRTVPFISKVTHLSLAKVAVRCMLGQSLKQQGLTQSRLATPPYFAVKRAIFPFNRFIGVDPILSPQMRSTGEVMGIGETFGEAYAKASLGVGQYLPKPGCAFISVCDADKPAAVQIARSLIDLKFTLIATQGTALALSQAGVPCDAVCKVGEGRPHVVDKIKNGEVQLIVNTTEGKNAITDSFIIRHNAIQYQVCYTTTLSGARAACLALAHGPLTQVNRLQTLHEKAKERENG